MCVARLLRASTRSMRVSVERAYVWLRTIPQKRAWSAYSRAISVPASGMRLCLVTHDSTETRMERVLARNKRAYQSIHHRFNSEKI